MGILKYASTITLDVSAVNINTYRRICVANTQGAVRHTKTVGKYCKLTFLNVLATVQFCYSADEGLMAKMF